MTEKFDLIIAGAGPAGTSAAIASKGSGLKIALIDKAQFPRDKVCGDFVMARGPRFISEYIPDLKDKLADFPEKAVNKSTAIYVDDYDPIIWDWVQRSITIKREDFDQLLLEEALKVEGLHFFPGETIKEVERSAGKIRVKTSNLEFEAPFIIGADGAHSPVAKNLADYKVDHNHYGGSVRAYYSGLENIAAETNEVYVSKNVLPGYFWLFPLSDSTANVGLGMHSRHIVPNKVNLKEVFYRFIEESPTLQSKMANAQMEGPLKGFGLPFYSKPFRLSGDQFILCGDAGSMIDPMNGEGIYQAIVSGLEAGKWLKKHLPQQQIGANYTSIYEKAMHKRFWPEMRTKAWLVKGFAHRSKLISGMAKLGIKNPWMLSTLKRMM